MKRFLVLLKFAACSSLAFAQWSTDPAQNLQILDNSIKPRIVTDGEGGAIVVGESFTQNPVLFAQRIDKHGYILWDPSLRGIRVTTAGDEQANVVVVSDDAGGAYVGFDARKIVGYAGEPPDPIYSSFVRVQHFDPNGNRLFGPEGVAVYPYSNNTNGGQVLFALVPDEHGGVYVLWSDIYGPQGEDKYLNHMSADGRVSWQSSFKLNAAGSGKRDFILYSDGEGGIIIHYVFSSLLKHNFMRIDRNGKVIHNKLVEAGLTVFNLFSAQNGEGIFLWQDFNQLQILDTLRYQKFDKNGEKLWAKYSIIADSNGLIANPRLTGVVHDRFGGAYFVYGKENRNSQLIHLDHTGMIVFKKLIISFNAATFSEQACMVPSDRNGVLYSTFVWETFGYACVVDSIGKELWPRLTYSTRQQDNSFDAVISDGNNGIIFSWFEILPRRGIWIQQVSGTGQLGIVTSVKEASGQSAIPKDFQLLPVYPNPFRGTVRIAYKLLRNEMVVVKVYNLSGKEVITLVEQKQASGLYEIVWNGRDQSGHPVSSGAYFCQWSAGTQKQANKLVLLRN